MTDVITQQVNDVLENLNQALVKKDPEAFASCFLDDGYWRDLLAFTWNIKTLECIQESIEKDSWVSL